MTLISLAQLHDIIVVNRPLLFSSKSVCVCVYEAKNGDSLIFLFYDLIPQNLSYLTSYSQLFHVSIQR